MRVISLVTLCFLIGIQTVGSAAAADKADKKAKGQRAGTVSRSLDSKLVGEAALDELTVTGESNSNPCVTCDPSDPLIQDKVSVPLPGGSASGMSFIAQEEARAAGTRLPTVTNPYVNFFQTVR